MKKPPESRHFVLTLTDVERLESALAEAKQHLDGNYTRPVGIDLKHELDGSCTFYFRPRAQKDRDHVSS